MALAPLVAYLATRAGSDMFPVSDSALINLRVRDVWDGELPLVGAYSRYGWNHPGPLVFWVLAPFSFVAGGAAWATAAGAVALQAAAIVATAAVAWRRGRVALVLGVTAGLALVYAAVGTEILFTTWNPHLALPFLPLFVLCVWSISVGDRWQWVAAVAVGTFLVQAHIGYTPLVAAGLLFAGATAFLDARRSEPRRENSRWMVVGGASAVTVVALWSPVLIEQLREEPGNLEEITRFFFDGDAGPVTGWRSGLGLLAAEYRWDSVWLGGSERVDVFTGIVHPSSMLWLLVAAAVLGVGALAARRNGSATDLRFVGLMALMNLAAAVALARVVAPPYPYLLQWRMVVAVFTVLAAGWAVGGWLRAHAPRPLRMVYAVIPATALLVAAGALTWSVLDHPAETSLLEPVVEEMMRDLSEMPAPEEPVLLQARFGGLDNLAAGLFNELDRRGVPVRADRATAFQVGEGRTADVDEVGSVWYVLLESKDLSLVSDLDGAEILAMHTPLPRSEARELTELQRRVASGLTRAGRRDLIDAVGHPFVASLLRDVEGLDRDDLDRLAALNLEVGTSGECHCGVVAFPPPGLLETAIQPVAVTPTRPTNNARRRYAMQSPPSRTRSSA